MLATVWFSMGISFLVHAISGLPSFVYTTLGSLSRQESVVN